MNTTASNGALLGQSAEVRAPASGPAQPAEVVLSGPARNTGAGASGSSDPSGVGPVQPELRVARVGHRRVFDRAQVDDDEREHLAHGVGARLRAARLAGGWTQRQLAAAAGCASTSVSRIEAGTRRPRRSMLASLAAVLDPDGQAGLLEALVDAAGSSLATETTAGTRRRRRRVRAAGARRRRELRRAESTLRLADAVIRQASRRTNSMFGRTHTNASILAALDEVQTAHRRAQELRAEAAGILARIGGPTPQSLSPSRASVRTCEPPPTRSARQAARQDTQ